MKEFPHRYYAIVEKLHQTTTTASYVVKSHFGEKDPELLKLYRGPFARPKLDQLEAELRWQSGLLHPHLLGISVAGLSGKSSLFTARPFIKERLVLSDLNTIHVTHLLDAIRFLHQQQRVHGGIKPSNLFVDNGVLRLADPQVGNGDSNETFDFIRFSAPEVLLGKAPTPESDYYSLGAILYRFYAGRDPFNDSLPINLREKYLQARIPPIRNYDRVRESTARSVEGLMSRNPRRRAVAFGELIREMSFVSESASRVPMVGRQELLQRLYSPNVPTATGSLNVILIEGNAGIGKSRLIEELEFKVAFHNSDLHKSVCLGKSEPGLAPILRLIRGMLVRHSIQKAIDVRVLLGSFENSLSALFEDLVEKTSHDGILHPTERIVQDLIGLISAFSRDRLLRLCIEDVDKAEVATRSFLRQICYRASELNVSLILTCRNSSAIAPAELETILGPAFTRISLDPLTKLESNELIRYLEPRCGSLKKVWSSAGGNPLWMIEQVSGRNHKSVQTVYASIQEETDLSLRKVLFALATSRVPLTSELLLRITSSCNNSVNEHLIRLKQLGMVHDLNGLYEIRSEGLRSAIQSEITARGRRTLHELIYKAIASKKGVPEEALANHAFNGGLWERAALHFTDLIQDMAKRGDNVAVLDQFQKLRKVLRRLNQKVPTEAQLTTAVCLARIGKATEAHRIVHRLATESEIDEDLRIQLSLLYSGGEIDRSNLVQRLRFLQEAVDSPSSELLHPAVLLCKLSASYVMAGDLISAKSALKRAQEKLEISPNLEGGEYLSGSEAFLLMNTGRFQAALDKYESLSIGTWGQSAAALTNRAFCLEHLGNIKSAVATQKQALRLAERAGLIAGQLLCLGNLGAFSTKQGNFIEAREFFRRMQLLLNELGSKSGIAFDGVEAEQALLQCLEARYSAVEQLVRSALGSPSLFRNVRYQLQLLECEIRISMGVDVKTSEIDQIAQEGGWTDSPLYGVQLALLRSRTMPKPDEALSVLGDALEAARNASLLYESCRLELEIAERMWETDPAGAKPHVEEALRISKKNGYRPLQCKALLVRALCGRNVKEKEHYLGLCFHLSTSVGIPEIVSESSYQLGVLYQSKGQDAAARECISTSTRVIAETAEQVPPRFRTAYLEMPWRKDARRRQEEHRMDRPIWVQAAGTESGLQDHRYFRALYRISIAASSSRSVEEFIRELLLAMATSRDRIVALLTHEGHSSWHCHGVTLTDAVRHRVLSVVAKAKGQSRFNFNDRWISFRSSQFSGGICLMSGKGSSMDEDEMEFFTMLGIFASSALDQIHNRVRSASVTSPVTEPFHGIVGNSRPIQELCLHISRISNNAATVLIQGETGTGKELVARAIHKLSSRSEAPFIAIDCGAIAEGLLESELFGSKRGSFTGAIADRPGVFEAAHTGTLFLDEVSNMNMAMQSRLLRVLQEREIRRVGETRSRHVDVRLIAASNSNLKQLVAEGRFRQDLLFRLNVISVSLPPLRSRREDIPALATHFLRQLNTRHKASKAFGPNALESLFTHSFPGNIRELQNSIERGYFTVSGQTIPSIPIETASGDEAINEAKKCLADLAEGRRDFWTEVRDRYRRRDISREKVVALIDLGLRKTRGSYKNLATLLHIEQDEYRRLMDFLRRNHCLLDFRPYRKVAPQS